MWKPRSILAGRDISRRLLRLATSGRSGLVYSKEQLPDAYKQEPAVKKILNVMDKIEFEDTGH